MSRLRRGYSPEVTPVSNSDRVYGCKRTTICQNTNSARPCLSAMIRDGSPVQDALTTSAELAWRRKPRALDWNLQHSGELISGRKYEINFPGQARSPCNLAHPLGPGDIAQGGGNRGRISQFQSGFPDTRPCRLRSPDVRLHPTAMFVR